MNEKKWGGSALFNNFFLLNLQLHSHIFIVMWQETSNSIREEECANLISRNKKMMLLWSWETETDAIFHFKVLGFFW